MTARNSQYRLALLYTEANSPAECADLEDAFGADGARKQVQELALARVDCTVGHAVRSAVLERMLGSVIERNQERVVEVVVADPVGIRCGQHGVLALEAFRGSTRV